MEFKPTLLILGASARAAAGSAIRAGFSPWCADLFADADLRRIAPAIRCPFERYPNAFAEILAAAPDAPWIYTGALENHPNLIRRLSELRPLWGNGPKAIRAARSPKFVEQILRDAGLPVPTVMPNRAELSAKKRWLRKPFAGSAGNGIAFIDPQSRRPSNRHYCQEFIDGTPMSAVFNSTTNKTTLLGATEQLIGTDWLNAPPFRYAGNVGPIKMSLSLERDLQRIGEVVGEKCDLVGPFGVDFILKDGRPWVVEINPRYTASVEVLELGTGIRSLAVGDFLVATEATIVGKAIWYTPHRIVMPNYEMADGEVGIRIRLDGSHEDIDCADVPSPGEVIEPLWPVMTILARAQTHDICLETLRYGADYLRRELCE